MKTMYYLESETRQKLKDFQKEKAYDRLRESATGTHFSTHPFHLVWTALVRLAHIPRHLLHPGQQRHEQSVKLERSLDET